MNEEKSNKKSDKIKKQWIQLGGVAAVFCVLVGSVLALGKTGVFDMKSKNHTAYDSEVISEDAAPGTDVMLAEGSVPIEQVLESAADYDDIYSRLATYFEEVYSEDNFSDMEQDFFSDGEELQEHEEEFYSIEQAISFTEVPEYEGVDGDVCESDATHAYLVRNDSALCIMKLDNSTMEHMSLISEYEHEMENVMDMHVRGDKLVLITTYAEEVNVEQGLFQEGTITYTYDITDPVYPVLMGSVEMEGHYMGMRMTDSGLYVYTNCYKNGFIDQSGNLVAMENLDLTAYVPSVNGTVLPAESVYMPNNVSDTSYMICVSVDLQTPDQVKDAKAFLSVGSQYYAGENGIYLMLKNGLYDVKNTVITRLDFADGEIRPTAAGVVDGSIMGSFALNEKDGTLRVISTVNSEKVSNNYLYILDEQMDISVKKESLASGELIQSIRFMGDKGYLATYGEKPVVSVDLSDKDMIGETAMLQPEGFDGYLYAYGENQILGISYALNETTLENEGIRLSVFDTSDSANIRTVNSVVIQADTTPAISNIHGLFVDVEKGLIGFPTEDWDENYVNVDNYYRLYSYSEENGFQSVLEARLGAGSCWYTRGFVIGSTFYVAEQASGNIRSYDMANGYGQTGEMYY